MGGVKIVSKKWGKYQHEIHQIYCGDQNDCNRWLKENSEEVIVDIQTSANHDGELVTIIYKTDKQEEEK